MMGLLTESSKLVDQKIEHTVFSARLREERRKRKWTQQALADLCGFTVAQINRYEAGDREPSLKGLYKISEVLHVSVDYLIGLTDDLYGLTAGFELDPRVREILDAFHREGWPGVARLSVEKVIGQ